MKNLEERYSKYDERVFDYMKIVINYFIKSYGAVSKEQILNFDMLADNFTIYYKALDDIKTRGVEANDSQGRLQRNPNVSLFLNTQNYIQKQLSAMGLTIASQARLKKGGVEESADKFIDDLIG